MHDSGAALGGMHKVKRAKTTTAPPKAGTSSYEFGATYASVTFATLNNGGTASANVAYSTGGSTTSSRTTTSDASTSASAVANNANSSSSDTGAKPVLSQPALYGIIGGAGAIGVALLAMLIWWCVKSKKAKKDEAKWWNIDGTPPDGKLAKGKPSRAVDSEIWDKGLGEQREKSWGIRNSIQPSESYSTSQYPPTSAAPAAAPAPTPLSAREQLFAATKPAQHDSIAFAGSNARLSDASSRYAEEPTVHTFPPTSPAPFTSLNSHPSSTPPQRPLRPSQLPQPKAVEAPVAEEPLSARAKKRQSSFYPRKTDTVMDFSAAYGGQEDEGGWATPPSPPRSTFVPPKRGASMNPSPAQSKPALSTSSSITDAFPIPPATTSPRADSSAPNAFGRVDSKPLRELEDILNSFEQEPVPTGYVHSSATSPFTRTAPVAPLNLSKSTMDPDRLAPSSSSGSLSGDRLAPSSSSGSLSPMAAGEMSRSLGGSYQVNHRVMSIYSSQGDIGVLPSPSNSPTTSFGLAQAQAQAMSRQGTPTKSHPSTPTTPTTPTIVRTDTQGGTQHYSRDSPGGSFDSQRSSLSLVSEDEAPSPVRAPQAVRKVNLQRTGPPVRLQSLRSSYSTMTEDQRQPTKAELSLVQEMGLDLDSPLDSTFASSPNSFTTASPPHTPRDSPSPTVHIGSGKLAEAQADSLEARGFVPLSAMAVDNGGYYRSATESIYGMYDESRMSNYGLSLR
ncbi:hypothetical protein MNV49_003297 [Pseudohyphozyma bogoriensis]|nr:hypothetical protein MNV49_003297 [Pseudohyphozyma bogoriensis]